MEYVLIFTEPLALKYGDRIAKQIESYFLKEIDSKYDCVDNYRVAELSDAEGMLDFQNKLLSGCCGEHNIVRRYHNPITDTEHVFLIGFNYGH